MSRSKTLRLPQTLAWLDMDPFDDIVITKAARRYLAAFDGWPARGDDTLRSALYWEMMHAQRLHVGRLRREGRLLSQRLSDLGHRQELRAS